MNMCSIQPNQTPLQSPMDLLEHLAACLPSTTGPLVMNLMERHVV